MRCEPYSQAAADGVRVDHRPHHEKRPPLRRPLPPRRPRLPHRARRQLPDDARSEDPPRPRRRRTRRGPEPSHPSRRAHERLLRPSGRSRASRTSTSKTRVDLAGDHGEEARLPHECRSTASFGEMTPHAITPGDVQAWIAGSTLKPSSVRRYMDTLRAILDYAGVDPNPARESPRPAPREDQHAGRAAEPRARSKRSSGRRHAVAARAHESWPRRGCASANSTRSEWRDVDKAGEPVPSPRREDRGGSQVGQPSLPS